MIDGHIKAIELKNILGARVQINTEIGDTAMYTESNDPRMTIYLISGLDILFERCRLFVLSNKG